MWDRFSVSLRPARVRKVEILQELLSTWSLKSTLLMHQVVSQTIHLMIADCCFLKIIL